MSDKHYLGNPLLKKTNTNIEITEEQLIELGKCSMDPNYFARNYMQIVTLDKGLQNFDMYPFQEKMLESFHKNRFNIALLPRQMGKPLFIQTPIPIPDGWSTIKEIEVGDSVLAPSGKEVKVVSKTETMYNRDCYKIHFDTGEEIIADYDHPWEVNCSYWSAGKRVATTKEIFDIYKTRKPNIRGGGVQGPIYIEKSNPVEFSKKDLKIEPYTLGLWLGDGHSRWGVITAHKDDYDFYKTRMEVELECPIDNSIIFKVKNLHTKLKVAKLLNNKHIPQEYLRSTFDDRLKLLRGLMDSDGSLTKNSRSFEFYQKNYSLIKQVAELLASLGIKSRIRDKIINEETYYTLSFTTTEIVFALPRKTAYIDLNKRTRKNEERHYIHHIEKVDSVPVACIQINSEEHLFLCGKSFIPTHNSTTVVSYLLYYAIFNENVTIAILANKAKTAIGILNRLQTGYENLPKWMQQGIKSWNKGSLELENGSKIVANSTSATAVRGDSYNIIFLDEYAFVPSHLADSFMNSVFPTITSGKESKIIIVSTPWGMNHFYKLWNDSIKGLSGYAPIRVYWNEHPNRDEKYKKEIISKIGQNAWDAEYECQFLGSSDTLISGQKLGNLVIEEPLKSRDLLDVYEDPQPDKVYVITVDVAEGVELDYSVFVVFDVSQIPYKVVAKYRNNDIPSLRFPDVIEPVGRHYNDAYILCEVNGEGCQVANILHLELDYPNMLQTKTLGRGGQVAGQNFSGKGVKYGIKMSKPVKKNGCLNLKTLIEEDKLIFNDNEIIDELTTFVSKYNSYSAEEGKNDDLAMCLVLLSWLCTQDYFKEITETDIRKKIREEHEKELEDNDTTPFGFISTVDNSNTEVDSEGNIWFATDNEEDFSYFWNYNF
jgi:intein/homing endonuclease